MSLPRKFNVPIIKTRTCNLVQLRRQKKSPLLLQSHLTNLLQFITHRLPTKLRLVNVNLFINSFILKIHLVFWDPRFPLPNFIHQILLNGQELNRLLLEELSPYRDIGRSQQPRVIADFGLAPQILDHILKPRAFLHLPHSPGLFQLQLCLAVIPGVSPQNGLLLQHQPHPCTPCEVRHVRQPLVRTRNILTLKLNH